MAYFDQVLRALRQGKTATREDYWRYTKFIFIGEITQGGGVVRNKDGNIILESQFNANDTIWKPDVHDIMGSDWTIL